MTLRAFAGAALVAVAAVTPAAAFNYVADANSTYWGIQDDAPPRVDTGSIRATQIAPGAFGLSSTFINGFGGIRVRVQKTPALRFNGAVMRGFGLAFDGVDRFRTTQSVDMGGVLVSRSVWINRGANWGRWLDTFTNSTRAPITIEVAFGGQSGIGPDASAVVMTSSGDGLVTREDAWIEVASPIQANGTFLGPQVTVVGRMDFAAHWLDDSLKRPLAYFGHDGNSRLM